MEIKLYTENTPELRERFEKAGIMFGRSRNCSWMSATSEYLYADIRDGGVTHGGENGGDFFGCAHATADEFFDAVCKWFGVEVKEEPEWKNWVPGVTRVIVSDDEGVFVDNVFIWLGYFNGLHLCVNVTYEKAFTNGDFFETITWKYAKLPESVKLTRKQIAEKFGIADDFQIVEE